MPIVKGDATITPQIYEAQSDASGNWNVNVDANLPAGPHSIIVQDSQGNQNEVIMYLLKDQSAALNIVNNVYSSMPPIFSYAVFSLLIIIAVLGIYALALARRADKAGLGTKPSNVKKALIVCLLLALVTSGIGLIINRETNFLGTVFNKPIAMININGQVINPLTLQGVSGVDLTVNNTTIKTSASGQFIFNQVNAKTGIRVTHPELLRALVFLPSGKASEENIIINFSPYLYNLVIGSAEAESMGDFSKVYDLLSAKIKNKISREDFLAKYNSILTAKNITDQELIITQTKMLDNWKSEVIDARFDKVLEITVSANGKTQKYHLIYEDNNWRLVQ